MAIHPSDDTTENIEAICSKQIEMVPEVPKIVSNKREIGTQTLLQLDPKELLGQQNDIDDNFDKIRFDEHPGTFSSEWDYKDRKVLEETRTFFNNFLVIERIYESDEKDEEEEGDCESCKSCETCKLSHGVSSKKSSENEDENDTVNNFKQIEIVDEIIPQRKESIPQIIVHRPSFSVPAMYKVDIEEIKERFHRSRGWCNYILGGVFFMGLVLCFALAFLGIEHMED